jgi:hypothetical protein
MPEPHLPSTSLDDVTGGLQNGKPQACEYVETHVNRVRAGEGANAGLLALGVAFDCGGARNLTSKQLMENGVTPDLVDTVRKANTHHQ